MNRILFLGAVCVTAHALLADPAAEKKTSQLIAHQAAVQSHDSTEPPRSIKAKKRKKSRLDFGRNSQSNFWDFGPGMHQKGGRNGAHARLQKYVERK
jgi:hypothetical protein